MLVYLHHLIDETFALLPNDIGSRNPNIVKENLARVWAPHSQLVQFAGNMNTCTKKDFIEWNFFLRCHD